MIVTCDDLSDPDNGAVDQPSSAVGSIATYVCNDDYLLVGSDTRTCQDNGEWSGEEPVCERKNKCQSKLYKVSSSII